MSPKITRTKRDPSFLWREDLVADAIEASRHASSEQWVFLRQVPNGPLATKTRTADAMAMGCWGSTGIEMHGYEIKISRSDWLSEIQDIKKAEQNSKFCHYWWVATPEGIAKVEECPAN